MAVELMPVAELRSRLAKTLDELANGRRPVYVTQRGQARAVLLPVKRYEELLERIEYLDDSLEALQGHMSYLAGERGRPLEEVMRDLRARDRDRAEGKRKTGRATARIPGRRSARGGG